MAARWPKSFIHFILLAMIIDNSFLCYQKSLVSVVSGSNPIYTFVFTRREGRLGPG